MRAKFYAILSLFLATGYTVQVNATLQEPVESFATLPIQYIETKIQAIQQAFEQRTVLFLKGRNYQPWKADKPKADILKEYDQLNDWRFHAWFVDPNASTLTAKEDFMLAQDLLEKGYYRKPNTIAFQYNQTDGSYNSSTIVLNGFRFLALEAPSAKNLKNFYTLLQNFHVTQLVRLTPAKENGVEKSYPYWQNKVKTNPKTKQTFLKIPQEFNSTSYLVRYYFTDNWLDDTAGNPQELLRLIQAARTNYDPSTDILACHCHAGVGRTGTFLAGFLLLNEIDRQIASGVKKTAINISIEKVVMQLSLQRSYMVGEADQYVTLYRLIDLYISTIKAKS